MNPLLVLGTTPYASVFIDSFEAIEGARFVGCVENMDRARCADRIMGLPVHWFEEIDELAATHDLVCALGTTRRAHWVGQMETRGFGFARLVHPSSVVSRRTELGAGVALDAGMVVAGFSTIGPHVRIGRRASIGHHTTIGAFSTIHPGAIISGNCTIGTQVTIGTGAVVIDGMAIGEGAVVAAGAVVNRPVAARSLVAGNPAVEKRADYGPK
jgi:sugar O-acyltransferase (sialic acid O-acetyltransferase NeuD family)